MPEKLRLAVFVVPRPRTAWKGADAIWITISGWATAAEKLLGKAVVFTSDQSSGPSEILDQPAVEEQISLGTKTRGVASVLPDFIKVFLSDVLLFFSKQNNELLKKDLFQEEVAFVWEQHDLFSGFGRKLATQIGSPFILYVHAPVVWEASKWGVKRYAWGKFLESMEARSLKKADCVAVVSEDVAEKVAAMGVKRERILVSPMAVNPEFFTVDHNESLKLRDQLQLRDKFVVGWTGSFRKFHGLDILIKGFAHFAVKNPEAVFLLVGEGALRREMEELVESLELVDRVMFLGKVDFARIPLIISVFDIAVVGAPQNGNFHYSPLKLREYMAAGKAVIAPRVGEIPKEFETHQIMLYEAGDTISLSGAITFLKNKVEERERIAGAGRQAIIQKNTWKREVEKTLDFLNIRV